jgi:glycosyltransferase involved in cell wall biosynthesis
MKSEQRIAVFLPSLNGGGAERVMVNLANAFANAGCHVDLVLGKARGPFLDEVCREIQIVDLGVARISMSLPGLVRYLRRERPTALLSSMHYVNVIALLARALSRVNTRVVVGEHNTLSKSVAHDLQGRMFRLLMRIMYPRAHSVVAVSQGVADDLAVSIGLDQGKIRVIYNPVVGPEIEARAREPLNHPWFQPGEPPVVLGAGRLVEQKDFGNLILAFAKLRSKRDCRLLILGEGPLRDQLECLIANLGLTDSISLPGFVANPFAYMSRAAVFALSSRWEGLPTVLIEAMACGVRVVATDCPSGAREILEEGVWGHLVPVGDPYALEAAIADALDDEDRPSLADRVNAFSVELARDKYLNALLN